MTIATIGRLMKKFDTFVSSAFDERVGYAPALLARWLRFDVHARVDTF
jgi:hypothetical protein